MSLACPSSLGPDENRLTSTNFVETNILAPDTEVLAAPAAVSHAFTATNVSSNVMSSAPTFSACSAVVTLTMASWTPCNLTATSCNKTSLATRSCASRCASFSCMSLSRLLLIRISTFASSSRTISEEPSILALTAVIEAMTASRALSTAFVALSKTSRFNDSSLICMVASWARSTSASAGVSLSIISATSFLATLRCMKSSLTDFSGFNLFCVSDSCCCNLPNSATARC
mmetsp:Transcript_8459/g.23533  ORF Transcript_8459/g.23533 Transcript_8459/m.23533 type:complete len:230 (+) Transcript_8459:4197-4886(+)